MNTIKNVEIHIQKPKKQQSAPKNWDMEIHISIDGYIACEDRRKVSGGGHYYKIDYDKHGASWALADQRIQRWVRDLFRLDVLSSEDAYGKWSIPHVSWDENYGRKTDDGKIALAGRFVIRQSASEPSKLLDKKAAAFMVEMHRNVIADGFVACIQSVYDARAKLAEDLDDHCAAKDLFLRDKLEHEKADVEEYKRATQEYEAGVADARSRYRNRISEIERGRDDRQRLAADAAERNYREQLHASGYDDDRIEKIISEWRKMTMVGSTSTGD